MVELVDALSFVALLSARVRKPECDKFVNWVSRVLQMRKGQNLNEFRVSCTLDRRYQKDIDSCLEYVLTRKVQSLELNFLHVGRYVSNQNYSYVFPDRLLNLCSDKFTGMPSSDSFGSHCLESFDFKFLKTLSLKGIHITGEAIDFFLLNCPYLERLEVVGSEKLVNLAISGPSLVLKYLKIQNCYNLKAISISCSKIISLNISAVEDLVLTQLPMLIELCIKGTSLQFRHAFSQASCFHSQLEALTLITDKPKAIFKLSELAQLTKLKRLVIDVSAYNDDSLTGLISFIKACPNLEELVLMLDWFMPCRSSRMLAKAERCSLKCLKVVEFLGYYGRVSDIELIMHVMENADGLEKVIVDPWNPSHVLPRGEEEPARILALQQFDDLKEYIPPHPC